MSPRPRRRSDQHGKPAFSATQRLAVQLAWLTVPTISAALLARTLKVSQPTISQSTTGRGLERNPEGDLDISTWMRLRAIWGTTAGRYDPPTWAEAFEEAKRQCAAITLACIRTKCGPRPVKK